MKKVMVFGTFDIFHPGHENFLSQARKYGDYLVVVIARDVTVEKVKKRKPLHNEQERMNTVEKSGSADEVVLGSLKNKYEVIEKYKPDLICLGYDQKFFVEGLQEKISELGTGTEVVRLKSFKPEKYKSSKLRND